MTTLHPILIVEDNLDLSDLFSYHLARLGLPLHACASLSSTLAYLNDNPSPAVIILDLNLEDGSGTSLFPLLEGKAFEATKTIVVSGQVYNCTNAADYRHIDQILMKPVSPSDLTCLVETMLYA